MRAAIAIALALAWGALAAGAEETDPARAEPVRHVDAAPPGATLAARFAEIRRLIQAALEYPPLARARGLEGETRVGFTIGADRKAREVRVARSSGEGLLDRAAARAVTDAGVLPYVHGPLEVPVIFALKER